MTNQEFMLDSETTITHFKIEDRNLIYIKHYPETEDINVFELFKMSGTFIEQPNTDVVFNYLGYEILISKKTTLSEVAEQYKRAREIKKYIDDFTKGQELERLVYNLSAKNAKEELRTISKILSDSNYDIPTYQLNYLSDTLLRVYKSTLQDPYFDSKIEDAKKYVKEKETKVM